MYITQIMEFTNSDKIAAYRKRKNAFIKTYKDDIEVMIPGAEVRLIMADTAIYDTPSEKELEMMYIFSTKECYLCKQVKEYSQFRRLLNNIHIHYSLCNECCIISSKTKINNNNLEYYADINKKYMEKLRFWIHKVCTRKPTKGYVDYKGTPDDELKYLGCNIYKFKKHIESQFESGMNWDNYGCGANRWCISHCTPLNYPVNMEVPLDVFIDRLYYTNMQPMWNYQSRSKGNRI